MKMRAFHDMEVSEDGVKDYDGPAASSVHPRMVMRTQPDIRNVHVQVRILQDDLKALQDGVKNMMG